MLRIDGWLSAVVALALTTPVMGPVLDRDQDGYPRWEDCDDRDPAVHPGALEICADGVDQDCDGVGDFAPAWHDRDADGWGGEAAEPQDVCAVIPGMSWQGGDCDDSDPSVYPGQGC